MTGLKYINVSLIDLKVDKKNSELNYLPYQSCHCYQYLELYFHQEEEDMPNYLEMSKCVSLAHSGSDASTDVGKRQFLVPFLEKDRDPTLKAEPTSIKTVILSPSGFYQ